MQLRNCPRCGGLTSSPAGACGICAAVVDGIDVMQFERIVDAFRAKAATLDRGPMPNKARKRRPVSETTPGASHSTPHRP